MNKSLSVIIASVTVLLFAYSANAGVVTDGLVSWWKLDETSGTLAADAWVINPNPGTLNGGATWTTTTAGTASSGALSFDGVDDYVRVEPSTSLDVTSGITVEAFFRTSSLAEQGIVARDNQWIAQLWGLRVTSRELYGVIWTSDGGLEVGKPMYEGDGYHRIAVDLDTWYHAAMTYDGAAVKFYVNGVLARTYAWTGDILTGATPLTIGVLTPQYYEFGNTGWLEGTVDEAKVYNRALSWTEIQQNYNAIPEPSTMLLLVGGGLLAFRRRMRRQKG